MEKNSFNPAEVDIMAKVVDEACQKLGYVDETTKQMLAYRVLNYAAQGERDFETLLSIALNGKAAPDAA
jgi:hypothetical protein